MSYKCEAISTGIDQATIDGEHVGFLIYDFNNLGIDTHGKVLVVVERVNMSLGYFDNSTEAELRLVNFLISINKYTETTSLYVKQTSLNQYHSLR
jgi:hypothetical protein